MAHIAKSTTKRGEPRYRVFIRRRGMKTVTKQFRRKTDAKRWASRTEAAIDEGRFFPKTEAEKRTVGELVERYIEEIVPERPDRDRPKVTNQLRWWTQNLGPLLLSDLKPALIAKQRDRLAKGKALCGRPVGPATVNRYLAVLSHACTLATKEWGWLQDNPVRRVRRLKEPSGRVRFLSEDERTHLLEACQASHDRRLYPLVLMAVSTGARWGELSALRWREVDLQRGYAVIEHSKNGDRRSLPLAGPLLEVLQEMAKVRRIKTDLVFAGPAGTVHFPKRVWVKALAEAEVEDFNFHDLRHTAASYLAMSGASLMEIASVLGHRTLAMVKRYSHLSEQHTAEVVARMNRRMLGV